MPDIPCRPGHRFQSFAFFLVECIIGTTTVGTTASVVIQSASMTTCAIYSRISVDRDNRSTSPTIQQEASRTLIAQKGWEVGEVYTDIDVSAFSGVTRPEYERLLNDVRAGRIDAICVYKLDRFSRSVQDFSNTWSLLQKHDVKLMSVNDAIDTSTPMGEAMMQMAWIFAQLESATISMRVRAKRQYDAEQGRWLRKGGNRAFGYDRDGNIIPEEAELIHYAVDQFIDGASLGDLCRDFNAKGLKTTAGGDFTSSTMGRILSNPVIAGWKLYRGELYPGQWEAILDEEKYTRLQAALENAKAPVQRREFGQYLLTGFIESHEGIPMYHTVVRTRRNPFDVYRTKSDDFGGASKRKGASIQVGMRQANHLVSQKLLAHIIEADVEQATEAVADQMVSDLEHQLKLDKESFADLVNQFFLHRQIPKEAYEATRTALQERIDATEAKLSRLSADAVPTSTIPTDPEELQKWWDKDSTPMEERRKVVAQWIEKVVVKPSTLLNKFDPERVEIIWR